MGFSPAFVLKLDLSSTEGALVSVAIRVEPQDLEALLEALAEVDFPVNPQIYHEAEILLVARNGRAERASTTLVEFPAYAGRLEEVYHALETHGFHRESVLVTSMLEELRAPLPGDPSASRPGWLVRSRQKQPVGAE
ncbi:MAG: hypothetical protein JO336_21305 [Acidobacteriia bacterium]|nr:hypothetical protein [Terriglobia bacterium]MBV8907207.1 hypothetical protein [Terriglobia bacterium]MBV9745626.1 hypothetical protein [Terriglobia bacterium]